MSRILKYALLPVLLVFVLSFQNCSRIQFTQLSSSDQQKTETDSGNGGVYEGKPGTYYRFVPGFTCEGHPAVFSSIDIQGSLASILFNFATKCDVQKDPVSTDGLGLKSINGLVIGYRDGIYERSETALDPQNPPPNPVEAFCQSLSPQADQVEVLVRTSLQATESQAQVFTLPANQAVKRLDFKALRKVVGLPEIRYVSEDFDLGFNVEQNVPGQLHIFPSRFSYQENGADRKLSLACRTGSSLDPSLILPAPGSPSQNFGVNGKVSVVNPVVGGQPNQLVELKNKKMLIPISKYGDTSFNLLRLNSDGTVDASFGTAGLVKQSLGSASSINKVIELSDQRLLVVGDSSGNGAILRLNSDGSLDTAFGSGGKVILDLGGPSDSFSDIQTDAAGNLLAIGQWGNNSTGVFLAVARFSKNGILDPSSGGIQKLAYPSAVNATVSSTNQLLLASNINSQGKSAGFGLVALRTDGALDTTFGSVVPGITGFDFGVSDQSLSLMKSLPNGKLLLAGRVNSDYGLVRFLENGQVDSSFGGGKGVVADGFLSDYLHDVVLQPDGKMIIIGGHSGAGPRLVRLDDDGQRDYGFGSDGSVNPNSSQDFVTLPTDALEPQSGYFTSDGHLRFVVLLQNGQIAVYELNL